MHRSKRAVLVLAAGCVGLLGLAGCGGDDSANVGQAGDKAKATRVIEVTQNDERFIPSFINVKPSETVTIRVSNKGTKIHEFFLGNEEEQDEREDLMNDMGSAPMNMADKPNSITIEPGASEEITWSFPKGGTIPFGCHQPGDFAKGLKGEIKVA